MERILNNLDKSSKLKINSFIKISKSIRHTQSSKMSKYGKKYMNFKNHSLK
jgi:hypothetical protein